MPEYAGAQKIGFLLGGGAAQMKREAFDEGRLNTAKTEDALANARKTQLEATAAAESQRAKHSFQEKYIANEVGKGRDPKTVAQEADLIGNLIIGGSAQDFYQAMQGMNQGQEFGNRETLADPTRPPAERLAAGSAIQGKLLPHFAPVGTHGVEDLTAPGSDLIKGPGSGTTAERNYDRYVELGGKGGPEAFAPFARPDQIASIGGVPVAHNAISNTNTPLASAEDVASNTEVTSEGRRTGTLRATQKADYPMVKYTLDQNKLNIKASNDIATEVFNDEKLWQTVGPTQIVANIPGTEGAYIRSKLDTLRSKTMLQTLINLRAMSKTGGAVGNVSDREGAVMEKAIAAISDPNITAGDFRKELGRLIAYNAEFEKNLQAAFDATYDAQGNPKLSMAPRGQPGAEGVEGGDGQSIEDLIINNGDGEYDDEGNLVRADGSGWTLETDASGNKAWVSPDRTQYEEVAQ